MLFIACRIVGEHDSEHMFAGRQSLSRDGKVVRALRQGQVRHIQAVDHHVDVAFTHR